RVEFGALSHAGKVRPNNEDHYGVVRRHRSRDVLFTNLPDGFLPPSCQEAHTMVVADGMGGAAFGDLASMLALRTAWDLTSHLYNWPFQINEREAQNVLEQLDVYGKRMHQALLEKARAVPKMSGMGSTITGILLVGTDAFIGHVGDSRAYLLRDNSLQRLTHDHTQAQKLVDVGAYASIADAPRFMRHILVNCLGGKEHDLYVETRHLSLVDGDRLLLCTDGLTDMVNDAEIASILAQHAAPADACQALVPPALDPAWREDGA